jgi:hypothetical protein
VDASTVNNLYRYAALFKSLKREGAEAAHSRADKFQEARREFGKYNKDFAAVLEQLWGKPLKDLDFKA